MSTWNSSGYTLNDAPYHYYPDFKLEPKHMKLELELDIAEKTVSGTNTITIAANADGAQSITFDAIDFDELEVVTDGIKWEYDEEKIEVTLDNPLNKGETTDITIRYKVIDPISGLYFSYPDDKYPERPVYVGSDHETERARYWIPAIDHPMVRTTYEYVLTSDENHTILAIGKKISEHIENGKKTVTWRHDYPCPTYITAIAAGELTEYVDRSADAGRGEIPIAYYTSSNYDPELLKITFGSTPEIMEWFISKFKVPFAWDKYFQFSFDRIFGAMENHTLVSWSDWAMMDQATSNEYQMAIDDTNVHEMAHTYFGDMVVVKNWSHAWLKESWATYCTALYREDKISKNEFLYDMYSNAESYFSEASKYVRPIVNNKYHSSWELFDSHLYPGGAWRLHMLRNILGDDVFFNAVIDYIDTFKGKTVETIDFQRKLEEHSGFSLGEFFDQWIKHPKGYPELKLGFSYNKEKGEGKYTITQKQMKKDSSDVKNRPFKFSIDLGWYREGKLHTQEVNIFQKIHEFSIPMEKPDFVTLDPNHKVLFKLESNLQDKMYQEMSKYGSMFAKIHAIKQLADSGKRKNISFIEGLYTGDTYYGIKIEIIKALGEANSRFAIEPLITISQSEQDPKVLRYIPARLVKYRDEKIKGALVKFLERDLPPLAKSSIVRNLGNFGDSELYELIENYLDDDGFKYIVRAEAFHGLAYTKESKYVQTLVDAVEYGAQPNKIRRMIISSLGKLGRWQDGKEKDLIIKSLEVQLRDPYPEIKVTAAQALIQMGSVSSVSKIRKIFNILPNQTVVSLKKQLKSMKSKSSKDSAIKQLSDKVKDLEEKLQKMDEKLQKME